MIYEDFYNFIRCETTVSAHTYDAYRRDLEQFRRFLTAELMHEDDNPCKASYADLRLWIASLASQHFATATILRKMSALRALYGYLIRHKGLEVNPAVRLVAPRAPHNLPDFIREEETERAIDALNADTDDFVTTRDALIVDMLYSTGIRESELIGLKNADVSGYGTVLLECMSNLVANELYQEGGAGARCVEAILEGVRKIREQCEHLIVVTNEIFSDGIEYDEETRQYQQYLGSINRQIASMAEVAAVVVYSIPLVYKGNPEAAG